MRTMRMSWWLIFATSTLLFSDLSEAKHGKHLPSAVVLVGTVYCDTCFQQDFTTTSHFISGASVAVKCGNENLKTSFYKQVKTNEHGVFELHLPDAVSVKRIKECSVKLISSSEPLCEVASSGTSSSLRLKARKKGTQVFSAGVFTFKPLKQPELCKRKPTLPGSKFAASLDAATSPPTIPNPTIPTIPTIPLIPLLPSLPPMPTLPPLPPLPGLPGLPNMPPLPTFGQQPKLPTQPKPTNTSPLSGTKTFHPTFLFPPIIPPILPTPAPSIGGIPLPPNPLQPAPLLPNPFQPPPPAFGIPGIPFQPPPPAFGIPGIPPILPTPFLPPIPVIMPSPPPPPPPSLLPPLPPLPKLPPLPFPGVPPASSPEKTSP